MSCTDEFVPSVTVCDMQLRVPAKCGLSSLKVVFSPSHSRAHRNLLGLGILLEGCYSIYDVEFVEE